MSWIESVVMQKISFLYLLLSFFLSPFLVLFSFLFSPLFIFPLSQTSSLFLLFHKKMKLMTFNIRLDSGGEPYASAPELPERFEGELPWSIRKWKVGDTVLMWEPDIVGFQVIYNFFFVLFCSPSLFLPFFVSTFKNYKCITIFTRSPFKYIYIYRNHFIIK